MTNLLIACHPRPCAGGTSGAKETQPNTRHPGAGTSPIPMPEARETVHPALLEGGFAALIRDGGRKGLPLVIPTSWAGSQTCLAG
jgi:hypothetical protein